MSEPHRVYSCAYDGSLRCGDLQQEVFDEVYILKRKKKCRVTIYGKILLTVLKTGQIIIWITAIYTWCLKLHNMSGRARGEM